MDWTRHFETIKDWRRLPGYPVEPHVGALLGQFLPAILEDLLDVRVRLLIPGFPLRRATVQPGLEGTPEAEQSWIADFLAVGDDHSWIVEFAGGPTPRDDRRREALETAALLGTAPLAEGILSLARAADRKSSLAHLLAKLARGGLLDDQGRRTARNTDLEILLVQPNPPVPPALGLGYPRIAEWLESRPDAGPFEFSFAQALRDWART